MKRPTSLLRLVRRSGTLADRAALKRAPNGQPGKAEAVSGFREKGREEPGSPQTNADMAKAAKTSAAEEAQAAISNARREAAPRG